MKSTGAVRRHPWLSACQRALKNFRRGWSPKERRSSDLLKSVKSSVVNRSPLELNKASPLSGFTTRPRLAPDLAILYACFHAAPSFAVSFPITNKVGLRILSNHRWRALRELPLSRKSLNEVETPSRTILPRRRRTS